MRPILIICTILMLSSSFVAVAASPSASIAHLMLTPPPSIPYAIVVAESMDGYGLAAASFDGSFVISEGLPNGVYSVTVSSTGYIGALLENVAVSNGNITDVGDVFMNASAVIQGMVVGPLGEPVCNAQVSLVSLDTNSTVGVAFSDASGAFIFNTDIRSGSYNVSAIPFSYPNTFTPGYTGNTTSGIAAVDGQLTSGIIVQMGRSCSVSGTVTESPSGEPLGGISIVIMSGGSYVGCAKTGPDGKYNISSNLLEGVYNVTVSSSAGFIYRTSAGMRTINLTYSQGATIDYSLSRSAVLSGYVSYSNGMPAPKVSIFCFSNDWSYVGSGYTNGSGYYRIASGLGTGTYSVVANNDNSNRKEINLVQNHEASMNFTISVSGATRGYVTGFVSSPSGSPIAGANISYGDGWVTSTSNGSYVVEACIPEGQANATLSLTCSVKGYVASSIVATVYPGAYSNADFSLQRGASGTIVGRVVSASLPPTKQNASLTLVVVPTNISLGSSLEISGALSVPTSGTIIVRWSINGSEFHDSLECDMAAGAYSCALIPSVIGDYSFRAEWSGDAYHESAKSPEASVSVLANATKQNSSLSLVANSSNATVGSNAALSGAISLDISTTVSIYQSINGSEMEHLLDVNASEGAFSVEVNLAQIGNYSFTASWPGNDDYYGATSDTVYIYALQAQQKVTPEVIIGSSSYAVTITSGVPAVVTVNGTVIPFSQTPILLWVNDPQNSSAAIPINATSYSFGATISLDKAGAWVIFAEVPQGEYYDRTLSSNITINVSVQQAAGDSTTLIVIAAAVVVGALLIFAFMRKKR